MTQAAHPSKQHANAGRKHSSGLSSGCGCRACCCVALSSRLRMRRCRPLARSRWASRPTQATLGAERRRTSQQHLNQQLPLDATFVDETGKTVKLGAVFRWQASGASGAGVLQVPDPLLGRAERSDRRARDGELSAGQGLPDRRHLASIPSETPAIAASKKREYRQVLRTSGERARAGTSSPASSRPSPRWRRPPVSAIPACPARTGKTTSSRMPAPSRS